MFRIDIELVADVLVNFPIRGQTSKSPHHASQDLNLRTRPTKIVSLFPESRGRLRQNHLNGTIC
jgi:hypothetical protein